MGKGWEWDGRGNGMEESEGGKRRVEGEGQRIGDGWGRRAALGGYYREGPHCV